ncbi:hypothetical protein LCGC14_1327300, partial [marine sediment metagenome]
MGIAINNSYKYDCPNNIVTMLADLVGFNSMGSGSFGVNMNSLSQQDQHSNTHIFLSIPVDTKKDSKVFEVTKQLELINGFLKDIKSANVTYEYNQDGYSKGTIAIYWE